MALIHGELDGELSSEQRADLARLLLADPQVRVLRDELRELCNRLGALGRAEPPPVLRDSMLKRLPPVPLATVAQTYRSASFGRWRLSAVVAGVVLGATIRHVTVTGDAA